MPHRNGLTSFSLRSQIRKPSRARLKQGIEKRFIRGEAGRYRFRDIFDRGEIRSLRAASRSGVASAALTAATSQCLLCLCDCSVGLIQSCQCLRKRLFRSRRGCRSGNKRYRRTRALSQTCADTAASPRTRR